MIDYFTKKDLEEFKEDIKRYLGILAGDFQHKLGFVIDGQLDIKLKMEGLKGEVEGLKDRVDRLEVKVDRVYSELIAHRDNTVIHGQQIKKKSK